MLVTFSKKLIEKGVSRELVLDALHDIGLKEEDYRERELEILGEQPTEKQPPVTTVDPTVIEREKEAQRAKEEMENKAAETGEDPHEETSSRKKKH